VGIFRLLVDWYSKIYAAVKWEGCISSLFCIKSGVRQGGVLSPALFNMYIRSLIDSLVKSDLGSHVYRVYIGCSIFSILSSIFSIFSIW